MKFVHYTFEISKNNPSVFRASRAFLFHNCQTREVFHIQSTDIVKVEKGMTSFSGSIGSVVYFILTANNGTKFTFGFVEGSVELSGGENNDSYQSEAWYLTKIEFTNGRNITLNYQSNKDIRFHFKSISTQSSYSTGSPVVLDNITFNGGKVVFTSAFSSYNISTCPDNLRMISQIEFQDTNNQKVSRAYLKYTPYVSSRYYILDSLRVDGKRYAFGYNMPSRLPDISQSFGTDYWGFYNGQPEKLGRISSGYRDIYLNQTLTITEKVPSEDYSKLGILTSLKYPTGETEYYEYEQNTYSHVGIQTLAGYYNKPLTESKKTGGLRIAKITRGNQIRKYKYVMSFDPNNPDNASSISSGNLYKIPAVACMSASEALNFLATDGEPPITYSKVIEFLTDKSYTEYNMYSPLNRPDGENDLNTTYYTVSATLPDIFTYVSQATFVGALGKNSSCALERGKLSEVKYYDSANNLKRMVAYTYSSAPNRYNDYVAALYVTGTGMPSMADRMGWLGFELGLQYLQNSNLYFGITHSYCIYTFPVCLEQEVVTDYSSGSATQHITKYRYNNKKLNSAVITYISNGDSIKTVLRYPSDINAGIYPSMVSLNMLNYPIETTTLKNGNITGSKLTTYKANGSSYVPDQVFSLGVTSPFAESGFTYFNGSSKDSRYGTVPEITFNSYNTSGKVTQLTGRDDVPVSYLWDVTGTYPMAEVKGATYSQISSLGGKACTYPSSDLWSSLTSMLSSAQVAAQVSTYSYKPLIGMASQTTPNGTTTRYVYDTFGRLYLTRDDDKNILARYRYGYQNNPDNGQGGYTAISASVSTGQTTYEPGSTGSATVTCTGGSGDFTYNWYLKNSSGTVLASKTNTTSTSFSFSCSESGYLTVQCDIADNSLMTSKTVTASINSAYAITMKPGYTKIVGEMSKSGTTISFYMAFYPTSVMQAGTYYLVATVSPSCRPLATRSITCTTDGRTWLITIYPSGEMYWKITSGSALNAYSAVGTPTLTYTL